MTLAPDDVVDRLFAAIQHNDVEALERLYADDFRLWHSFDNSTKDRTKCLELIRTLGHVATKQYRLIESIVKDDRVVRRYELTLNAPGRWSDYRVNLVFFLTIAGDRVASMEEYIDSRDAAEAIAAVQAAGIVLTSV